MSTRRELEQKFADFGKSLNNGFEPEFAEYYFNMMYAEGRIVKKLNPDGTLMLKNGEQIWVADFDATPEELAYWRKENAN